MRSSIHYLLLSLTPLLIIYYNSAKSFYGLKNNIVKREESEFKDLMQKKSIESILQNMTLEEKIGQMIQVAIYDILQSQHKINKTKLDEIARLNVGSIISPFILEESGGRQSLTVFEWRHSIAQIQQAFVRQGSLPIIYGLDSIHGAVYLQNATAFPRPLNTAATFNVELVRRMGYITGKDTLASGVPWVFSPILGIARQKLWCRVYETYGEDPYLASVMGATYVRGLQSTPKIAACMKHFIAYSNPTSGHDRSNNEISDFSLMNYYVPSFKAATEAGVKSAMESYNSVNEAPNVSSKKLLKSLLRHDMNFRGLLVTDWSEIDSLHSWHRVAKSSKDAARLVLQKTSIDIIMTPANRSDVMANMKALVEEGAIPEERINLSVRRILKLKYSAGLLNQPVPGEQYISSIGSPNDLEVALQLARESVVLLKNDDAVLPITQGKTVFVTGPTANNFYYMCGGYTLGWQKNGDPVHGSVHGKTVLQGIRQVMNQAGLTPTFLPVVETDGSYHPHDFKKGMKIASESDYTVIFAGESNYAEKRGDIDDLNLPGGQLEYIKALSTTNTKVVLVLIEGRPRLLKDIPKLAGAILYAMLPCEQGGQAIAEILFGHVNPSGKLPITYPKTTANANIPYFHERSLYCTANNTFKECAVEWSFGHGLSYTTFEYSNLRIAEARLSRMDVLRVSLTVTNTGSRNGQETILLFISQAYRERAEPEVKLLKSWQKIFLESNASKTVDFELEWSALATTIPDVGKGIHGEVEAGVFGVFMELWVVSEVRGCGLTVFNGQVTVQLPVNSAIEFCAPHKQEIGWRRMEEQLTAYFQQTLTLSDASALLDKRTRLILDINHLPDDFKPAMVVAQLLRSTFRCNHRRSMQELEGFLKQLLQIEAFADQIILVFVERIKNKCRLFAQTYGSARLTILRLSNIVMLHCLEQKKSDLVKELAAAQATLLEGMVGDAKSLRESAIKTVTSLLSKFPALSAVYLELLISTSQQQKPSSPMDTYFYMTYLLISSSTIELSKEDQSQLLQSYMFYVYSSKQQFSLAELNCWNPLLAKVSLNDYCEIIEPTLAKVLKKSPDAYLYAVCHLLQVLTIDLSKSVPSLFLPVIVAKCKSQNDDIRQSCVDLVRFLSYRCGDLDILKQIVEKLSALIEGKNGILAQFYQRQTVLRCFTALLGCYQVMDVSEVSNLAQFASSGLARAIEKATHDKTKHLALVSLGQWLQKLESIPQEAMDLIKKGLKEPSKSSSYMHCLWVASGNNFNDTKEHQLMEFSTSLNSIVAEASKKSNQTEPAAIMACDILARLPLVQDSPVLSVVGDPNAFVYQAYRQLSMVKDGQAQDELWSESLDHGALFGLSHLLCVSFKHIQKSGSNAIRACSDALIYLSLHEDKNVRDRCCSDISKLVNVFLPDAAESLLGSLFDAIAQQQISEDSDYQFYFIQSLNSVLPAKVQEIDAIIKLLPKALVLIHHPLVDGVATTKRKSSKLWRTMRRRFITPAEDVVEDDAVDQLFENERLQQALETEFSHFLGLPDEKYSALLEIAFVRSIASLFDFAGTGASESFVLDRIVKPLGENLINSPVLKVTEQDLRIYNTPEGVIALPDAKDSDSSATSNKNRKSKDELWEEQVRAEIQAKKKQQNQTNGQVDAKTQKILKQEQEVRSSVKAVRDQSLHILRVITLLSLRCPDQMHTSLPYILQPVYNMVASELVAYEAYDCLRQLLRCLCVELRQLSDAIAACLRLVVLGQQNAYLQVAGSSFGTVVNGVKSVVSYENEIALQPPSFHAIFPILSAILASTLSSTPALSDLREDALIVLAPHTRIIAEEEEMEIGDIDAQKLLRHDMIVTTLRVLADAPKAVPSPVELLTNICGGRALSMDEWVPLLNEMGLLNESNFVRAACFHALLAMSEEAEEGKSLHLEEPIVQSRLWLLQFDDTEMEEQSAKKVGELAQLFWSKNQCRLLESYAEPLQDLLGHQNEQIRLFTATALAKGMLEYPATAEAVLGQLIAIYESKLKLGVELQSGSKKDSFGIPDLRHDASKEIENASTFVPRVGVAKALEVACQLEACTQEQALHIFSFVVDTGLSDSKLQVRTQMMQAGVAIVDSYGKALIREMLAVLDNILDREQNTANKQSAARALAAYDHQREGVVVCMGSLAKHMELTDPKVVSIVNSLLDALRIPAETVQRSVSNCLVALAKAIKEDSEKYIDRLLNEATTGETYGDRLGASFGFAALIKGLGISALKKFSVIPRLEEALKGKVPEAKQGALFLLECLCERLGFLFEPYVIVLLPSLLRSFSDNSLQVREAAQMTSRRIMSNLSAHGVKLVLPSLVKTLEENSAWRTKHAALQMLGSMAHCAPRQLGSCLPQVVPKLTEALGDSHVKVREAGSKALKDIGSVIRNPEIAALSAVLLGALSDPNIKTTVALQQLQQTHFVHTIDAPSLALINPILHRGLKGQDGDTKKTAAFIVGNMCSMISDVKDILPYLNTLVPGLQHILMDPIPEVRTVASKAIGKLVKGVGQEHFPAVLSWLMSSLKSDTSSVERSGAAQGLCEVLVALGHEVLDSTLQELFSLAEHPKYYVREGILWVMTFLPPVLGAAFGKYTGRTLAIILPGLSDENETVRDVAMRGGRILVHTYAVSHTELILPSLEKGLFDESWRIRHSSVTLLGEMLYKIGGTRAVGLADADDDEGVGNSAVDEAIVKALGMEARNRILSTLYMIRSDTSSVVRQGSLQVWKTIVSNTPRTLREIVSTLMSILLDGLSSDNTDRRTIAGSCLGEIVVKLGDRIMPEVIPILRAGLSPNQPCEMRQGVCLGLTFVIQSSSNRQLEEMIGALMQAVKDALCDDTAAVREAAAQAFQMLQRRVGAKAVDEIIPSLLTVIETESDIDERTKAIQGLQEILCLRSRDVLPFLIPKLLSTPLSLQHLQALQSVVEVTGDTIHYHLNTLFKALLPALIEAHEQQNQSDQEMIKGTLEVLLLSITDTGVNSLTIEMSKIIEHSSSLHRVFGCWMLASFCKETKADYSDYLRLFLRQITQCLNDADDLVLISALDALRGINKTTKPEALSEHLEFVRNQINSMVSDARHRKGGVGQGEYFLPALCKPKALEPFLPMYQHALLQGSASGRENAASGLGELIKLTHPTTLRPFLIKLTGPLIRIVGDRFPGHVKASILKTLGILLEHGGVGLKPFLPQLQTTFVKALSDEDSVVRERGSESLGKLMKLSTRIDPLATELCDKAQSSSLGDIRLTNLKALYHVLKNVSEKVSAKAHDKIFEAVFEILREDQTVAAVKMAGESLLCISKLVSEDRRQELFEHYQTPQSEVDTEAREMETICILNALAASNCENLMKSSKSRAVQDLVDAFGKSSTEFMETTLECTANILAHFPAWSKDASMLPLIQAFGKLRSTDPRVLCCYLRLLTKLGEKSPEQVRDRSVELLVPCLVHLDNKTKDIQVAMDQMFRTCLEIESSDKDDYTSHFHQVLSADQKKKFVEYTKKRLSKL